MQGSVGSEVQGLGFSKGLGGLNVSGLGFTVQGLDFFQCLGRILRCQRQEDMDALASKVSAARTGSKNLKRSRGLASCI